MTEYSNSKYTKVILYNNQIFSVLMQKTAYSSFIQKIHQVFLLPHSSKLIWSLQPTMKTTSWYQSWFKSNIGSFGKVMKWTTTTLRLRKEGEKWTMPPTMIYDMLLMVSCALSQIVHSQFWEEYLYHRRCQDIVMCSVLFVNATIRRIGYMFLIIRGIKRLQRLWYKKNYGAIFNAFSICGIRCDTFYIQCFQKGLRPSSGIENPPP